MAKKKTTKSSEAEDLSASSLTALVEQRAAALAGTVAATRVKAGWSFSPAMDLLWAAGWPDLHVLDPAPREDAAEQARALCAGLWEEGTMPVAKAALSALIRVQLDGSYAAQGELDPRTEALLSRGDDWSMDELASRIREQVSPVGALSAVGVLRSSSIEALVGARATVDAVLAGFESWSDEELAEWCVDACRFLHELGIVLLRLSPDDHRNAMTRLRALAARAADQWQGAPHEYDSVREGGWLVATLELLVGGDQGALRRGAQFEGRLQQRALDFVENPQLVVDACSGFPLGKWGFIHGRALWLGGEPVLRWCRDQWRKFSAPNAHTQIVRVLGEVRSPIVTECMLAMASDSKAKKPARAWFGSHRAYALETLPALADGPHGALARAILDELE